MTVEEQKQPMICVIRSPLDRARSALFRTKHRYWYDMVAENPSDLHHIPQVDVHKGRVDHWFGWEQWINALPEQANRSHWEFDDRYGERMFRGDEEVANFNRYYEADRRLYNSFKKLAPSRDLKEVYP